MTLHAEVSDEHALTSRPRRVCTSAAVVTGREQIAQQRETEVQHHLSRMFCKKVEHASALCPRQPCSQLPWGSSSRVSPPDTCFKSHRLQVPETRSKGRACEPYQYVVSDNSCVVCWNTVFTFGAQEDGIFDGQTRARMCRHDARRNDIWHGQLCVATEASPVHTHHHTPSHTPSHTHHHTHMLHRTAGVVQ